MSLNEKRQAVLDAARAHVVFDGWSNETLVASGADAGLAPDELRMLFPRGALDLAEAFHLAGDALLAEAMAAADLSEMRYSDRVAHAIMLRLEIAAADREAVRRAATFFALPIHAVTGSKCIWHTADVIWTGLGDTSRDANWYSKRAILSGVYSASLLFWLGDESPDFADTRAFVDRRIADVMAFEKTKAKVKGTKAYELFRRGPGRLLDAIKAPGQSPAEDLPGYWRD